MGEAAFIGPDGNEWRVEWRSETGWAVEGGAVRHWHQDGEWTEPLCDSAVREVLPQWIWDALDDQLDPRRVGS